MKPLCRYIAEVTRIRHKLFGDISRGAIIDASEGLLKKTIPVENQGRFAQSPCKMENFP